ncbi:MAG: RNA methyltransferase [Thermoanaerobaculia bacterium]|nr:RNA methyltransferase [Thermoanaerobaculia bacterium]
MSGAEGPTPVVVLVGPQLAENIGAAARAMLNCGLDRLRLVRPRHGWPDPDAVPAAAGAGAVLDRAEVFADTAAAIADATRVYATTARLRDMIKPTVTPREAAREMRRLAAAGERVALLFGPERTGLDNDDVVRASRIVHVPLNPRFSSLNLAQAVLVLAYEWRLAGEAEVPRRRDPKSWERGATGDELANFFDHLEEELEAGGFFEVPAKKPAMQRAIRNVFSRAELTEQEVRTLHGVVTALVGRPRRRREDS